MFLSLCHLSFSVFPFVLLQGVRGSIVFSSFIWVPRLSKVCKKENSIKFVGYVCWKVSVKVSVIVFSLLHEVCHNRNLCVSLFMDGVSRVRVDRPVGWPVTMIKVRGSPSQQLYVTPYETGTKSRRTGEPGWVSKETSPLVTYTKQGWVRWGLLSSGVPFTPEVSSFSGRHSNWSIQWTWRDSNKKSSFYPHSHIYYHS